MKKLHALALTSALAFGIALPGLATPLTEMRAEDLLPMAQEFRKTLELNANQQTLFNQVESKTRAVLRDRQSRRERLQQKAATSLIQPNAELRDISQALDAETAATAAEETALRAQWMDLVDALNDKQRQAVLALVLEQMQRVQHPDAKSAPARSKDEGGQHQRGMGGRRGAGGQGGSPIGGGLPGGQ